MKFLHSPFVKLCTLFAALTFAGCYGGKIVKMPINADLTFKRLDTLQTRQEIIMQTLDTLSLELRRERKERLRGSASSSIRLSEIEEMLQILSSKLDDSLQLMQNIRSTGKPVRPRPVVGRADTARSSAADTLMAVPPSGDRGEEEKLFKSSYMDLTLGNISLALQGFKNYIARHPGGAHIPEVHYYLGECYYSTDKYLEAVGEYQFVIREFPRSRLVPAAYLKSGLCYARLDEPGLAERSFRELISQYPHSEEAEHAKAALKDIGG